MKNMRLAADL